MAKVIILIGCSGAGKSTWIKQHYPKGIVCSADDYFIEDGRYVFNIKKLGEAHIQCLRKFIDYSSYLAVTEVLIVDNTNTTIEQIAPYVAIGRAYGHEVELVIIETPPEVAIERNKHNTPPKTITAQFNNIQRLKFPSYWKIKKTIIS